MSIRKKPHHGIFYLEGYWENLGGGEIPCSSQPLLQMMEQSLWRKPEPSHEWHRVKTVAQFNALLAHWAASMAERMPILVLAFPDDFEGEKKKGFLRFGSDTNKEYSDCEKVAKLIAKNRVVKTPFVVHFSTCRALGDSEIFKHHAAKFLKTSGAAAVSAYTKEVDWNDASALDLLWFNRLMGRNLMTANVDDARTEVQELAPKLIAKLGFRVEVQGS